MQRITAYWPALVILFTLGCTPQSSTTPGASAANAAEESAEAVTLQTLDYAGLQELLASHRGKIVVMDCWSTWCDPCIKEFPNLVALDKKFSDDAVACVSLCFDFTGLGDVEESREQALGFLTEQKATFDNVLSSTSDTELYEKLDFPSVPAVFVYNQQGELVQRFDESNDGQPFSYSQVEELVEKLMK